MAFDLGTLMNMSHFGNISQEVWQTLGNNGLKIINGTHVELGDDYYYPYMEYEDYYGDFDACVYNMNISRADYSNPIQNAPGYKIFFKTLLPIVCAIGIVGIIITIMVLSRKSMVTSTNCYLISLAVADLGFLIILSTKFFEILIKGEHFIKFDIYFTYAQIFLHTFLLASVWLTVMLATERYIAICHPLRAISICTVCRARFIIVTIFVFSFYCRCPNFFEQEVRIANPHCPVDKQIQTIVATELGQSVMYKITYAWVVECILSAILPFIALVFLNIRLIIEIHRSTKYLRCHLGTDSSMQNVVSGEQIKITMMLISIILVFFICQAPYVLTIAYRNIHKYSVKENSILISPTMQIVTQATIFMLTLKSSFNFVMYCWFSEKFWNTFKRLCCIRTCIRHRRNRRKNGHVIHSADQGITLSARKTSCMTKGDTIC